MNPPKNRQHWYAVYTAPRAEKKVSDRFLEVGVEHYLPLQTVQRQWSDRVKDVIVPVIRGYIFVHIELKDIQKVLDVFGAIAFVKEFYKPVSIPDEQIARLKFMVDFSDEPVEFSEEQLQPGQPVIIVKGSLQGLVGELIEIKGKHKVILRINRFGCAQATIPLSFIKADHDQSKVKIQKKKCDIINKAPI